MLLQRVVIVVIVISRLVSRQMLLLRRDVFLFEARLAIQVCIVQGWLAQLADLSSNECYGGLQGGRNELKLFVQFLQREVADECQ